MKNQELRETQRAKENFKETIMSIFREIRENFVLLKQKQDAITKQNQTRINSWKLKT